jgi:hypothetical protein
MHKLSTLGIVPSVLQSEATAGNLRLDIILTANEINISASKQMTGP